MSQFFTITAQSGIGKDEVEPWFTLYPTLEAAKATIQTTLDEDAQALRDMDPESFVEPDPLVWEDDWADPNTGKIKAWKTYSEFDDTTYTIAQVSMANDDVPVLVPDSVPLAIVARALASERIAMTHKDGNFRLELAK